MKCKRQTSEKEMRTKAESYAQFCAALDWHDKRTKRQRALDKAFAEFVAWSADRGAVIDHKHRAELLAIMTRAYDQVTALCTSTARRAQ